MIQLDQIRLRDWLRQGWILERRTNSADSRASGVTGDFLIGGGRVAPLSLEDLERSSCAVWAPDFFSDFSALSESPQNPCESQWSRVVSRDELIGWLSRADVKKVFEKSEMTVPSAKVSWRLPSEKKFDDAFRRIGRAFREEGVKKAVPVVFSRGRAAMSDRFAWIGDRVLAGLGATLSNDLRLYGAWSEESGFLGATPEDLFTRRGDMVSSMAVAGTRAWPARDSRFGLAKDGDGDSLAEFIEDFLKDAKERNEHELVVRDIDAVLGGAEKSETRVQRFGALFHLVTDLTKKQSGLTSILSLVTGLHPTPALGVAPRDSSLRLLKELHEICGEGVARGNFGAPFVVKHEGEVHAVVAIRQMRWSFDDSDRAEIIVGSGCGIVPESQVEREWTELAAKRQAVMRMFRLSVEKSEPVFWSLQLLQRLVAIGVRRFVVCAGARNAPLVVAAEALKGSIKVESFFEERSAAFYALGLARSLRQPVAVLTTSGTAASELLAAMTEADFSGVPLIAVTADRPRRLRLSGAPQTIQQDRVFESVVEKIWDLEEGDVLNGLDQVSRIRPLHINVCLEEPLLADAERDPKRLFELAARVTALMPLVTTDTATSSAPSIAPSIATASVALEQFLTKHEAKAAIIGALVESERAAVADFLLHHRIPALLEGPSGLRGDARLRELELHGGDRDLQRFVLDGQLTGILRIGGVPTTRVWRDLDDVHVSTQTLSLSRLRFSGLSRGGFICLPEPGQLAKFLNESTPRASTLRPNLGSDSAVRRDLLVADQLSAARLEKALLVNPLSEPALVREFSLAAPRDAIVYVGNSLPIRWWDQVATREYGRTVEANRGVNGIDGQLSTALGLAAGFGHELWVLIGDLTALYDLTAPWALSRELALMKDPPKVRIVVLNNSGGRIFNRVLAKAPGGSKPFENSHELGFKNWATMWGLEYLKIEEANRLSEASAFLGQNAVIELIPTVEQTSAFWKIVEAKGET